MKKYLAYVLAALLVLALMPTMALADRTIAVGTDQALQDAINNAQAGDTIQLTADITLEGTGQLGVNNQAYYAITASNITIDGQDHTITIKNTQHEGSYSGPILFGFNGSEASGTVKDLKIEVTNKGVKHALQAYKGANLDVVNVTVRGCLGYALVVNGSKVTVKGKYGLVTSGNGSGGINVDLGSGVTTPAALTIWEAKIEEETSVKVEHSNSKNVKVTATIEDGSFHSVVNSAGQTENTALTVSGGTFAIRPTKYVSNNTVCTVNGITYVNTSEGIAQDQDIIGKLKEGCSITVWKGDLNLPNLPADAKVINMGSGKVTVHGKQVRPGESYPPQPTKPTEPTKPIAGVVIGGGNQQEDEDEPEQSPSNTLRYAVICRTLNVRSGPGTEYSKLGALSRGTLLDGELLSNGWVKFSYNGQTAYVSGMYVQSVDNGQLSVQCGTLNVRSGAGTSYSKIGALYRGTYVKPLETQGNWYKIGYDGGYGWICADYVG